jgi:hypothetical protein
MIELDPTSVQARTNEGEMPLHIVLKYRPSQDCQFFAEHLLALYSEAARTAAHDGQYPLHLILKHRPHNDKLDLTQTILEAYPAAVKCGDPVTNRMPFMMAAACSDAEKGDDTEMDSVPSSNQSKPCLSTTFTLLERDPLLLFVGQAVDRCEVNAASG